MAQRSARARSKLDKITAANGPAQPTQQRDRRPGLGGLGGARLGSGGLLTPSASSVSGSSSRNSLQLSPPQRVSKGTLRSFFDAQGEKLRGRLTHGNQRKESSDDSKSFYTGLGGGLSGSGHGAVGFGGMAGLGAMAEERIDVRRWEGSGSRGELWDGGGNGKKDLELWYPDGDTLVYLTDKPLPPRNPQGLYKPPTPHPSFRLRSTVLRKTGSLYLISLLEQSLQQVRPPTPIAGDEISEEPQAREQLMDFEYQLRRARTQDSMTLSHPTTTQTHNGTEEGIIYRLYFPAPARLDNVMRHRHHLATRNFFAVLCNQSLVGITFGQSLTDLLERTEQYLSSTSTQYCIGDRPVSDIEAFFNSGTHTMQRQSSPTASINALRLILGYLQTREFDDVRNWPEGAAGLVVFSERAAKLLGNNPSLYETERLEGLWREGFVHCTGLLSSLQLLPEWRDISPITKALIDRASLEIQVRVSNADARMSGFNFHDMWPASMAGSPARLAFDRFQKFLNKHYSSQLGSWPPGEGKFTRTLYQHLQRDFSTLYSYLVDQDTAWHGRTIIKPSNPSASVDDTLPISEILSTFDSTENHPPIPHPFPLVPPTNTISVAEAPKKQKGFSFPSTTSKNRSSGNAGAALVALAFSESTNIDALKSTTIANPLLEAFQLHEKSISLHEISPHDARKGRWVLIYGVLQTLASVAVDAPGLVWTEGVDYWINPKLRGTPPWKTPTSQEEVDERSHFRSHCWTAFRGEERSRKYLRVAEGKRPVAMTGFEADRESGDEGDDEME